MNVHRVDQRKLDTIDRSQSPQMAAVLQQHGIIGIAVGRLDERDADHVAVARGALPAAGLTGSLATCAVQSRAPAGS